MVIGWTAVFRAISGQSFMPVVLIGGRISDRWRQETQRLMEVMTKMEDQDTLEMLVQNEQDPDERNQNVEDALYLMILRGNFQACKYWLENRIPERWGEQSQKDNTEGWDMISLAELINNPIEREDIKGWPG